jgi:Calcineurin-like phosphoesterase.
LKRVVKLFVAYTFVVIFLLYSTCSAYSEATGEKAGKSVLKFNTNGKFKIMMFNDTQDTDKTVKDTIRLINNSLDKVKPDLVVVVGDNIAGFWLGVNEKKVAKAIDNIIGPINDRKIPFAIVFGNHDQETGVSKEKQMEMYMSYEYCLAVDEGSSISNCGTYNLLIKDSEGKNNVFNIWMVDSGTSAKDGGYESVHEDQIQWYEKTAAELKKENGGKPMPSLLFQHIPVPEIYDLLTVVPEGTEGAIKGYRVKSKNRYILNSEIVAGKLLEAPCSPDKNSGEFAAWQRQGDILGAYFGHDHVNDFKGNLKGIDLGYTPGSGFFQYGNGIYRGVRTFELDQNNLWSYKTEVLYYKDLVASKANTSINDPYFNCVLRVAIPLILAIFIVLLLVLLFTIALVRKIRRNIN